MKLSDFGAVIKESKTENKRSMAGYNNITTTLLPGDCYDGVPEIAIFEKTSKKGNKYSIIRLTIRDQERKQYVSFYTTCNNPDTNGVIHNIGTADFTYNTYKFVSSFLEQTVGVVSSNFIAEINIEQVMDYINDLDHVSVDIIPGKGSNSRPTFEITELH